MRTHPNHSKRHSIIINARLLVIVRKWHLDRHPLSQHLYKRVPRLDTRLRYLRRVEKEVQDALEGDYLRHKNLRVSGHSAVLLLEAACRNSCDGQSERRHVEHVPRDHRVVVPPHQRILIYVLVAVLVVKPQIVPLELKFR